MCEHEVVGDFYRGCQHFHARYYTGEVTDCKAEECKTSSNHMHKTARRCDCSTVVTELRRVQNMIQMPHEDCAPAFPRR
ncbi:hypothetical protein PsYK624_091820 [Phanerochaete sordida]|uniref:Uncharacterized protein n=1 Tax=Phanerochaete sordida TaxID=48140 RepID=A0A9P3GDQ9_9APHY|nr:hypothetical protein PsYK624_091820 [Phanerochaete sordida]